MSTVIESVSELNKNSRQARAHAKHGAVMDEGCPARILHPEASVCWPAFGGASPCVDVDLLDIRQADNFLARCIGLALSPPLLPGEGLLLTPCRWVQSAFMTYAIDVIFLDRNGVILKVVAGFGPWQMTGCAGAWQALELAAGEAARLKLTVGGSLARALHNSVIPR